MLARIAAIAALGGATLAAQQPAAAEARRPNPALIEVASIVRNTSNTGGGIAIRPGGSLVITNTRIRPLVEMAHRLQPSQLVGGPDWINAESYDIVVKSATGNLDLVGMTDVLLALLAERFRLRTHVEARELPVFALVMASPDRRPGPQLTPVAAGCFSAPEPGKPVRCNIGTPAGRIVGAGVNLGMLASMLSSPMGRVVVDRTGLDGHFDLTVEYVPDATAPGAAAGVPLVTALQEQLGLKLEAARAPVDVTVIDAIERPTLN